MAGISKDEFQHLLWSFAGHRALTVASRVGIMRLLADNPATIEAVADSLDLEIYATGKIVRALNAIGIVETQGGTYRLCPWLVPHFKKGSDDFAPFLEHSHQMFDRWGENLESWLRGEPWRTHRRSPEGIKRFGDAMQAMASMVAKQVIEAMDLTGVGRLLDIGGSIGAYARAFCDASEEIQATVFDTPEVAAFGSEAIAETKYEGRIDFVGGDYLKAECGSGYDLVLIASVLHQELEEDAQALVDHAAHCVAPGGRLAVVDFSIDPDRHQNPIGALFAINMRSFGDTYPEPTIKKWMHNAGLKDVQRTDLGTVRWLIMGRKPVQ